jgi:hypothetical protein
LRLTAPRGKQAAWPALANSEREIADIETHWKHRGPSSQPDKLSGPEATERNLRLRAGQARYLHLATHGFFDPVGLRSIWDRNGGDAAALLAGVLPVGSRSCSRDWRWPERTARLKSATTVF